MSPHKKIIQRTEKRRNCKSLIMRQVQNGLKFRVFEAKVELARKTALPAHQFVGYFPSV
jgi:hypothetical protein